MITEDMIMPIGRIFKPHSFRGEINVEFDYDVVSEDLEGEFLFVKIDNIPVPFRVETLRGGRNQNSFLKLKGINSEMEAAKISNRDLYIEKARLAEILGVEQEDLEFEAEGLIGFKVTDSDNNTPIGIVEDIEEGVEYDYLVVRRIADDGLLKIPMIEEFIDNIEEGKGDEKGIITVTLPEGFLDI